MVDQSDSQSPALSEIDILSQALDALSDDWSSASTFIEYKLEEAALATFARQNEILQQIAICLMNPKHVSISHKNRETWY